ncbi:ATP-binding protein [Pseudomonas sp. NPDC087346]|uniref:ATP-binding protein n=1 Tax=Pseudomonas sp. NPDC087346 TaxID=3364438 RepID=UPI00382E8944
MSIRKKLFQQWPYSLTGQYRTLGWRPLLLSFLIYCFLSQGVQATEPIQLEPQASLPLIKLTLPPPELSWLQARRVVRVGIGEQDYGPLSLLRNRKFKGLMADYVSIITNSLGLSVQVSVYPDWPSALQGLRSGEVDVLGLGSSYEAQLPGLLLSTPYTANQPVLVGRDIGAEPSLANSRLAMVEGYASTDELQAHFPDAYVKLYASVREALHAVQYQHADWAVCDAVTAAYQIGLGELPNLRMRPLADLHDPGYSFVFRESDPLLMALFNQVIFSIPLATRSNIRTYWGGNVYFEAAQEPLYTPEQIRWLATRPQVQVAVSGSAPPYSFFDNDGNFSGIVADLLDEISQRSGLHFEVVERNSAQETVDTLRKGDAQISPFVAATPEHKEFLNFTEPFGTSSFALIGIHGSTINSLEDPRNKRVSLIRGTPMIDGLRKSHPDITFVETESPLESLLAVANGRVDTAVVLLPIARYMINQYFTKNLSVLTSLPKLRVNLSFAVTKAQPMLFDVLEATFSQIEPRMVGTLLERWQDSPPSEGNAWSNYERRLRWFAIVAGTVIGMLLMWFVYSVFRRIRSQAEKGRQAFRSALLDGLPQPVVMRDLNGTFLLCNDAFYDVFGLQAADVIGHKWEEVQGLKGVQENDPKHTYETLLEANEPSVCLIAFRINEVLRNYRQWVVPHRDASGRCIGLLMGWIDMSDTEHLLHQLYAVRDQAVQASEAKTRFLTVMSHEIRTPLHAIIGLLEVTLARVDKGEEWDRTTIEAAHSSSNALMFLIGEILDLSKIEAGKLILEPQRNNPKELVESVGRVFHGLADQKGLYLTLDFQLDSASDAWIDGARLKQVLFNLLNNAIKFTDRGGVKVSLHVQQVGAQLQMGFVVEDTGIGISSENLKLLFQPFSQISGPENNRGGTGLGLVICQQLIELMKGSLQLSSTPERGTRIKLMLNAPALDAASSEASSKSISQRSALRVLLVDDHPANRLLLWHQLVLLGHTVKEAENGLQAFNLMKQEPFDVVITDCHMPIMDGYELTRLIREDEHASGRLPGPIIGFTANAQVSERQRCLAEGMNDCLFKPVSLEMLKTCLSGTPVETNPMRITSSLVTPKSAVLDLVTFNSLTGSDPAVERLLLDSLYATNCLDLKQFDEFLSTKRWQDLARLVHRLKGAARMVGAQVLIEAAEIYEQQNHNELAEEETIRSAIEVRVAITQLQEAVTERLSA